MRRSAKCAVLMVMFLGPVAANAAVTPELQKSIRENTFEVVMKKPEKDQVTYEKPLPLDLMPYIERTDAYRSVGTAFALGHNTYVTAGHVIVAAINSQFGPPVLRRSDGSVFEIDRILKFSADADFVEFSLRNDLNLQGLEPDRSPQLDQQVLAVGNALGEGIVIRDGLFTSETPEQQDGRWKWIRFSAAASPGNSGGPLCAANGRVIGVIIGKSENENLNYSLPIGRVLDASTGVASFDERRLAGLPLVHGTVSYSFKDQFPLPLSWSAFVQAYTKVADHHFDESQSQVLASSAATLFPNGAGSLDVLYRTEGADERPQLISQSPDGSWTASGPEYHAVDLTQDGTVEVGDIAGIKLIHLTRPAHASDDAFYGDSKSFMDLALKGLDIRRPVGPDKVRVTSLGAAAFSAIFIDDYGRKWQERSWPVPFFDLYLVAELLPTPDGYDGIITLAPSLSQHDARQTARWLAQHLDVGYSGTLEQWQAMLKRKDLLPRVLEGIKLTHREGWTLETSRVNSSITPEVLPLNERSILSLGMGFLDEKPTVSLVIDAIRWDLDDRRTVGVVVWRSERPPVNAKLDLRNHFDSIATRRVPYDGSVNRTSAETFSMTRILDVPGKTPGTQASDLKYAVTLDLDHYQPAGQMGSRISALEQGTHVLERGKGSEMAATSHPSTDDAALSADISAEQQAAMAYAQDAQDFMGRDLRGREMTDDLRDYLQVFAKQLAGKPPTEAQRHDMQQHITWIRSYWLAYPALAHNRDMWSEFLRRNHMPDSTQHSDNVLNVQAALLGTLSAGYPSENSGDIAKRLLRAFVEERASLVRSIAPPPDLNLLPRTSPCPTAVTRVNVTRNPAFANSTSSLDQLWPVESKRLGEEGTVLARLNISAQGCVKRLAIQGSSGSEMLDSTVLRFAETMSFRPGSDDDGKPIETTVTVPIVFKLTEDK